MKHLAKGLIFFGMGTGLFLFLQQKNVLTISDIPKELAMTAATSTQEIVIPKNRDIENQKTLANPPKVIKALYATSWSASSEKKIKYFIDIIKSTEINALVIDIKDYSGIIAYDIKDPKVDEYKAKEIRIPFINRLIKRLHDEGIYVIARVTVFQDPILAKARPDLAVQSKATGGVWLDNKKISWVDPTHKEVWDYVINISKDAAARGFDEINFDYIRFPSDGKLADMQFSGWAGTTPRHTEIAKFFKYLREQLPGTVISADLFGLVTINKDDLGIGQLIEDAYQYFDYVSPMVYPSHYASGFLGFKNPAQYPYEVVKYSMEHARDRLIKMNELANATSTPPEEVRAPIGKLRPWLQDFDLGANYDVAEVQKQIQAVGDAGLSDGFMLWNPSNIYTRRALAPEDIAAGL